MAKKPYEWRYDRYGPIRKMTEAEGHVMIRRPRAAPHVISAKEWGALSREPVSTADRQHAILHVGRVFQ